MTKNMFEHIEVLNESIIKIFNQLSDLENNYLKSQGTLDVSINELRLMNIVEVMENPTMSDISIQASITNGSTTTAIKKLEKKGYVNRVTDTHDKRVTRVTLTNKGKNIVNIYREFKDDMGDLVDDKKTTIDIDRIIQGLEQLTYFFDVMKERY